MWLAPFIRLSIPYTKVGHFEGGFLCLGTGAVYTHEPDQSHGPSQYKKVKEEHRLHEFGNEGRIRYRKP